MVALRVTSTLSIGAHVAACSAGRWSHGRVCHFEPADSRSLRRAIQPCIELKEAGLKYSCVSRSVCL